MQLRHCEQLMPKKGLRNPSCICTHSDYTAAQNSPASKTHLVFHALVAQQLKAQSSPASATHFAFHAVVAQSLKAALPQEPTLHSMQ